ncbi:MAG: YceI family protein [Oligoflexales bacterium]
MKQKRILNLLSIFCLAVPMGVAYAESPGTLAKITLSPVGSFDVKSPTIVGKLVRKGSVFSASELKVPVESLKTGISLRDTHLKEKLNEKKHPFIIANNVAATSDKGKASIMIAGVTKEIEFKIKDLGSNLAQATFTLVLPEFKLSGISYKGVGVEDETEVTAVIPYEGQ